MQRKSTPPGSKGSRTPTPRRAGVSCARPRPPEGRVWTSTGWPAPPCSPTCCSRCTASCARGRTRSSAGRRRAQAVRPHGGTPHRLGGCERRGGHAQASLAFDEGEPDRARAPRGFGLSRTRKKYDACLTRICPAGRHSSRRIKTAGWRPRSKEKRMRKLIAKSVVAAVLLAGASPAVAQEMVAGDDNTTAQYVEPRSCRWPSESRTASRTPRPTTGARPKPPTSSASPEPSERRPRRDRRPEPGRRLRGRCLDLLLGTRRLAGEPGSFGARALFGARSCGRKLPGRGCSRSLGAARI